MLRKMRHRFITVAMISFSAIMLILICGINLMNTIQVRKSQDEMLNGILEYSQTVSSDTAEKPPINEMPWTGGKDREFTARFFVVHCDEDGNPDVFGSDYISSIDKNTAEEYTKTVLEKGKEKGNYKDFRYLVSEEDQGLIVVFLNVSDSNEFCRSLLMVSLLIGAVSLMAVFILVLLLSKPVMDPYIKNIERQKKFITDASHELKTPITSISTSTDIAVMEFGENEWLENIRTQVQRLSGLVNSLVTLSRLDEEMPFPEKTEFSLSEVLWEAAETFGVQAKASGRSFSQEIEENLTLVGNRSSVQQLFSVLLENALKYSDENGWISMKAYCHHNRPFIEISNSCSLPESLDTERLFDRFYRPDESRSQETGGYGIGLSIAKAVVEMHGGAISAKTTDHQSITFIISL